MEKVRQKKEERSSRKIQIPAERNLNQANPNIIYSKLKEGLPIHNVGTIWKMTKSERTEQNVILAKR